MLLIKSLLVLCTATVVLAADSFDAVSSVGYFSGEDISDPDATGLRVFTDRKNRGAAVATIAQHCADFTDFKPAELGVNIAPWSYTYFIRKLNVFPALKKTTSEVVRLDLIGTVNQLVGEIEYIYDNFKKEKDYPLDPKVARNFRLLVPKTLDNPQQKRWLLNQVAIHNVPHADKYRIELVRLTLRMSEDPKTGKAKIDEQVTTLSRDVFTVDTTWITEHAQLLAKELPTVNVKQAISFLTTKAPRRDELFDEEVSFCEEPEKEQYDFYGRSRFSLQ